MHKDVIIDFFKKLGTLAVGLSILGSIAFFIFRPEIQQINDFKSFRKTQPRLDSIQSAKIEALKDRVIKDSIQRAKDREKWQETFQVGLRADRQGNLWFRDRHDEIYRVYKDNFYSTENYTYFYYYDKDGIKIYCY